MSRIGKSPIQIPEKVAVTLNGLSVTVKGPKGELSRTLPNGVNVSQVDQTLIVSPDNHSITLINHSRTILLHFFSFFDFRALRCIGNSY